jgi:geranylgeranyl diphosphate synthase, type I
VSEGEPVAGAPDGAAALGRYHAEIAAALRETLARAARLTARSPETSEPLETMYGQIEYHLGWRDQEFRPAQSHPGKLLRPALVLLAAELAGGRDAVARALPLAAAIELIHNFSLIHDDIEDGDEMRRGRSTAWKVWGPAQAINSGDALFSLARIRALDMARLGVEPALVVRLVELVDLTCLELCEGQHLDMTFEGRGDVTEAMYLDMISRKTAALMACAAESGARVGAPQHEALGSRMAAFGRALGLGFQLRDDVLGIWSAATKLGKTEAGDVRRKKMTLPVIHALDHASAADRDELRAIYSEREQVSDEQVARALAILDRSGARARAYGALREQLDVAVGALDEARELARPHNAHVDEVGAALAGLLALIRADAEDTGAEDTGAGE